jgi:hypothetical protein
VIAQALYFLAAVAAAVGCRAAFRKEAVRREVMPRSLASVEGAPLDRLRDRRDLVQSYGRSALAVAAGGWAVLVALSCVFTVVTGRF